jgi:hypothetical protein
MKTCHVAAVFGGFGKYPVPMAIGKTGKVNGLTNLNLV